MKLNAYKSYEIVVGDFVLHDCLSIEGGLRTAHSIHGHSCLLRHHMSAPRSVALHSSSGSCYVS